LILNFTFVIYMPGHPDSVRNVAILLSHTWEISNLFHYLSLWRWAIVILPACTLFLISWMHGAL